MTLRNAFESVATEGTLRRLIQSLNFARDTNDRLRITMDSGTVSSVQIMNWGNNSAWPTYYGVGSPMSMDPRDQYRVSLRANVIQARQHRWVIT